MGRIERGFRLARASWEVLKADRELMILPVVSFVATAIVAASLFAVAWGTSGIPGDGKQPTVIHYVLLGIFYFLAYFIAIFCNAALVGAATIRLNGGDPTVKDGLKIAASRIDKIIGWAALAATVGLILRSLEEKAGFLGRIVIAIVGAAWSAVTFFVVPVLIYEDLGVVDSVKRSGSLFKQRWGEQFVGNASIGIVIFLLVIPVAIVGYLLMQVVAVLGVVVLVLGIGALTAAGGAMSGIFNAALYRFATTGEAAGAFTADDLRGSFRPRRGGRGIGGFGGPFGG
ncbi:MAG: DUF6159 family protein [Actinomycetota bacterium]|nr:DUF6159 family protein [Actinomycetota bacterium]